MLPLIIGLFAFVAGAASLYGTLVQESHSLFKKLLLLTICCGFAAISAHSFYEVVSSHGLSIHFH